MAKLIIMAAALIGKAWSPSMSQNEVSQIYADDYEAWANQLGDDVLYAGQPVPGESEPQPAELSEQIENDENQKLAPRPSEWGMFSKTRFEQTATPPSPSMTPAFR